MQHTGRVLGSESWHTWVGMLPGEECGGWNRSSRMRAEERTRTGCYPAVLLRRTWGSLSRLSPSPVQWPRVQHWSMYGSSSRLPPPFLQGPLQRRRLLGLPSWSILIWLLGNLEKSSLVFFLHFSSFVCVLFSLHDEALISQMNFIQNLIVLGWNADCRGISYRSPQQCGLGTDLLVMREIDWV